jgi:hypothetical protein
MAAAAPALEQDEQDQSVLRPTLAPTSEMRGSSVRDGDAGRAVPPRQAQYGNPPGSGAGGSGFISTNVPSRRTKAKKKAITSAPLPRPTPAPRITVLRTRPVVRESSVLRESPVVDNTAPARPRRLPLEDDPYAAIGVPVGTFVLRSSFEVMEGYDNNPSHVQGGRGSAFTVVAPDVAFRSDWARHGLSGEIKGSYTAYSGASGLDRPDGSAVLRGRIDVTPTTRVELEAISRVWTEYPGSPDAISTAVRLPLVYSFGGTAGIVQRLGRVELGVWGGAEHSTYENALLSSGATFDLAFRDFTTTAARMRAGYEVDPGFKPFIEGVIDRRDYDQAVDPSGFRRSSDGYTLRAGIVFDRKDWLTGEISAGYTRRTYDDATLPDIAGPVIDSALVWRATALTTVTFAATSAVEETILVNASGRFRHEGRITVDHAFRRWLIGSVYFSYGHENYVGADRLDKRTRAGAMLTYYLNPTLAVRGEFRHERLTSDVPGQDYTANIMLVGLRLQR